jgi:LysM repeat protein
LQIPPGTYNGDVAKVKAAIGVSTDPSEVKVWKVNRSKDLVAGTFVRVDCVGVDGAPKPPTPQPTPEAQPAPAPAPAAPAAPEAAPAQAASGTAYQGQQDYYVTSGESLWSIAREAGVTPEALAAANGLRLDAGLFVRDILKIPSAKPGGSTPQLPQPGATTVPVPVPPGDAGPAPSPFPVRPSDECSTQGIIPRQGGYYTDGDHHEDVGTTVYRDGCFVLGGMTPYEQLKYAGSGARIALEGVNVEHTLAGDPHCDARLEGNKIFVYRKDGYDSCDVQLTFKTPDGAAGVVQIGNTKVVIADEIGGRLGDHAPDSVVRASDPWGKIYEFDTLLKRQPKVVGVNIQKRNRDVSDRCNTRRGPRSKYC